MALKGADGRAVAHEHAVIANSMTSMPVMQSHAFSCSTGHENRRGALRSWSCPPTSIVFMLTLLQSGGWMWKALLK